MDLIKKILQVLSVGITRTIAGFRQNRGVRTVVLEIVNTDNVRILREMIIPFTLRGYRAVYRAFFNRRTLSVLRSLSWHPDVVLKWSDARTSQLCEFYVTDNPVRWQRLAKDGRPLKKVLVHYDYRPDLQLEAGHYTMSIPMHTQIYCQYNDHEKLPGYRASRRKMKLFFAGNWSSGYRDAMKIKYGKLSRDEIVEFLLSWNTAKIIRDDNGLGHILEGDYLNAVVLVDKSHRIDQQHWLGLVAKADFFLCPPGLAIPWSHNAVEAMAVGTIPLINYPEWFYPTLVDRENCVTFETLEELEAKIQNIISMSPEEILAIRRNVCTYYDKYLDPRRLVENMVADQADALHLHIWDVA